MQDIRVIQQPEGGRCLIAGDFHGRLDLFLEFLKMVGDQDQPIFVGDLIDRGPDSLKLIKAIVEFNQQRKARGLRPIEVVRGNHEQIFLDYYANRDKLKDDPDALIFNEAIGGKWVKDLDEDQLKFLADYFSTLPYILHVEGPEPFDVVHAGMPISAAVLAERLAAGIHSLTKEERHSAIWDRPSTEGTYTLESILAYRVYVGHSINGGLRRDTNHINVDVGGCYFDNLCVVCHETSICTLIGDPEMRSPEMLAVVGEIIEHFDFIALMRNIIKIKDTPELNDKFQKIVSLIETYVNHYYQYHKPTAAEYYFDIINDCVFPIMQAEMATEFLNYLKTKSALPTFEQLVCGWEKNEKLSPEDRAQLIHKTLHYMVTQDLGIAVDKPIDKPSVQLSYNINYLKNLNSKQRLFSESTKIALGRHLSKKYRPKPLAGMFSGGVTPFVASALIILDISSADIKLVPEKPGAVATERKEVKEVKEEKKGAPAPRLA